MIKRSRTVAIILAIVLAVAMVAFPATANNQDALETMPIYVNGLLEGRSYLYNGHSYVTADNMALIYGIDGDGWYDYDTGDAEYTADGLTLTYHNGDNYCVANGRYLYMPEGILEVEGVAYYPISMLCKVFGFAVSWNEDRHSADLDTSEQAILESGESYYGRNNRELLARIIQAEAGNQPFEGMVAVGNVVMNRVNSDRFPDTVYDVVYQSGQFDPVYNGSINNVPSDDAVLASYLCLDGMNTAGDALFFQNPSASSVIFSGLSYITTIGDHVFYR